MWLCPGKFLPEPGAGLQLAGARATEWQSPEIKTYARGQSGVIRTGEDGGLDSCLGSVDVGLESMGAAGWGRRWGSWTGRS